MKIYIAKNNSDEITNAFGELMKQLNPEIEAPSHSVLTDIIQSDNTPVFIASEVGADGDKIVGTLTLAIIKTPSGTKAQIEDVVVNQNARGKGIGKQLMLEAINYVRKSGIKKIDLTSSPNRLEANKLYQKLGFELRNTNIYRLHL